MRSPTAAPGSARALRRRSALLLAGLLAAGAAAGQNQPVGPPLLEFSFSSPGARSMGFGGAFVALADDATAAFANPAGLVQLLRPEVSIEGRSWSYSTAFTAGGRAEGRPTGIGLDTEPGLRTARSTAGRDAVAFLSFVYPWQRGALAVYRHELANFESASATQGIFGGDSAVAPPRFLDRLGTTDLDVASYGVSAAYRVTPTLSLGAGLAYFDGAMRTTTTTFRPDDDSAAARFAPNSYLPERNFARTRSDLGGTDWGLIGGVLWSPAGRWRVGAVYRQGPELAGEALVFAGPALHPAVPAGTLLARGTTPFVLPDVSAVGVAYRSAGGGFTASFEWDRVEYSDIIAGLNPEVAPKEDLVGEDADELHLGAEYVFLRSTPIVAVRLGAWLDPDHRLRNRGDDPFARALLRGGDDEIHLAAGLGLVFGELQLDLGADFSDPVDTLSLSAIYSF